MLQLRYCYAPPFVVNCYANATTRSTSTKLEFSCIQTQTPNSIDSNQDFTNLFITRYLLPASSPAYNFYMRYYENTAKNINNSFYPCTLPLLGVVLKTYETSRYFIFKVSKPSLKEITARINLFFRDRLEKNYVNVLPFALYNRNISFVFVSSRNT